MGKVLLRGENLNTISSKCVLKIYVGVQLTASKFLQGKRCQIIIMRRTSYDKHTIIMKGEDREDENEEAPKHDIVLT